MKISNIRNLFLVSLALPLVMLFGCSSSEESSGGSDTSGGSSDGGHDCSMYPVESAREECEMLKDAAG